MRYILGRGDKMLAKTAIKIRPLTVGKTKRLSRFGPGMPPLLKKLDRQALTLYFFLTFWTLKEWTRCSALATADFFTFIASLARVCPARAECPENTNRQTKPWAGKQPTAFFISRAVEKIFSAFCHFTPCALSTNKESDPPCG